MEINENVIGDLVRKYREEKGLTQYMLAKKAGIDNKTVNRWENGQIRNMSIITFARLMNVLGYDISIGIYEKKEEREL